MSVPNTSELDDDQIEALIRKLSAIKGSAPELIAALETEANSRLSKQSHRSASSANRSGGRAGQRQTSNNSRARAAQQLQQQEDEEEDDEEDDDDDDEETDSDEEDDEFDDDGPCVGQGYSDEVSVISEMTTPTVVSGIHIADEERYKELGKGPRKPDLLGQVNRVNAAKQKANKNKVSAASAATAAGLNAERRKTYTSGLAAMAKISETTEAPAVTRPKTAVSRPAAATKTTSTNKGPVRKGSSDGTGARKTTRGLRRDHSPSRGNAASGTMKKKSSAPTSSSNKAASSSGTAKPVTKKSSSRQRQAAAASNNAFTDDWHKSLTAGDFNDGNQMDDNGFPFSFGDADNNAFGSSSNSFFNDKNTALKKTSSRGNGNGNGNNSGSNMSSSNNETTTDPFDPFNSGDPFATARNAFTDKGSSATAGRTKVAPKTKATGSRPRRTSKR